jgi:hypothetical protein
MQNYQGLLGAEVSSSLEPENLMERGTAIQEYNTEVCWKREIAPNLEISLLFYRKTRELYLKKVYTNI